MPGFTKGPNYGDNFGHPQFLRSTENTAYESYTVAASTIETVVVDGVNTKPLKPGTVLAKITSGGDAGKVGPYDADAGVTDGRQTLANIVGINRTYLPTQLGHRDVEVSVLYHGTVIESKIVKYDAGTEAALDTTARDAMVGGTSVDILFV